MSDISFGPTISAFIQSPCRRKFIVGPVGSGKTIGCIHLILILATQQEAAPDGIRYTRWAVCRETLQQAKQTVLKDMLLFFKGFAHWKVSESTVFIKTGDVDCEIMFYPLDTPEDQKRLLSTQLTGCFFNEFIEIDPELVIAAYGRCGRYPPKKMVKPSWYGLIGDSNPGTKDSPWYNLLVEDLPNGWEYYHQDDPFEVDEEGDMVMRENVDNAEHLPETYYHDLLEGASAAWAERYVHGQWGDSLSGQAVFKGSFIPAFHISATELVPQQGRILIVGLDTGRHPAAVLCQMDNRTRFTCLAEAWAENTGMSRFLREYVKPLVHDPRFSGCPVVCVVDPAGRQRSQIGEESVIDAIKAEGFDAYAASTNAIAPRLRAVEKPMLEQRDGGPAFLIDLIHCPDLIRALRSGYHYKIRKSDKELNEAPEKNHPDSDLADALQYAALGTGRSVLGRIMRLQQTVKEEAPPVAGWAG